MLYKVKYSCRSVININPILFNSDLQNTAVFPANEILVLALSVLFSVRHAFKIHTKPVCIVAILKLKTLSVAVWPCITDACLHIKQLTRLILLDVIYWGRPTYIFISSICIFTFQILIFCRMIVQVSDAVVHFPWWRHQMETFSALLALCVGNSPVTGEFPSQRPVTWIFDVFFDLRRNKRAIWDVIPLIVTSL